MILDIMMPELDGFQVLRKIRESSNVPVIMLSAKGKVADRVVGLELGADDYLAKPFEPQELLARIQSILRRVSSSNELVDIIHFDGLSVNKIKQEIPEDLDALVKRAVSLQSHLKVNKGDRKNVRSLELLEAKVHRLSKYYKRKNIISLGDQVTQSCELFGILGTIHIPDQFSKGFPMKLDLIKTCSSQASLEDPY